MTDDQNSPAPSAAPVAPRPTAGSILNKWLVEPLGTGFAFLSKAFRYRVFELFIVALLIYYSGFPAFLWSYIRDCPYFFDPNGEGLVILDTPQLFTRERLLNERLRESEWIDKQIELVDEKLTQKEFGKPTAIELTDWLVKLKGGAALDNKTNQNSDSQEDADNAVQRNGDASTALDAYTLLKDAGGLSPSPQAAFDSAWDFRERLSQERYATILDDAHDLGENTLHRLNFNLTVVPARASTDLLVAVGVRIGETFDSQQVMELYSRLVVDARKKMQESVEQVLSDRALIFSNDISYRLDPTEESFINLTVVKKFNSFFLPVKHTLPLAMSLAENKSEDDLINGIINGIKKNDASGSWSGLIEEGGTAAEKDKVAFLPVAVQKFKNECRPYTLVELDPENKSAALNEKKYRVAELKREIAALQATYVSSNSIARKGIDAIMRNKEYELSESEGMLRQKQISITCVSQKNSAIIASLRLIGIEYHLWNDLRGKFGQKYTCFGIKRAMEAAVSIVLGEDKRIDDLSMQQGYRTCDPVIIAARLLRMRVDSTGAEIGLTGLAVVLTEFLNERPMESATRKGSLKGFFEFSVESCTVEHCQIQVRTISESAPHTSEAYPNGDPEVGRREALRLFLTLTCFANVRSYTVWPRAGDRGTIVGAERETMVGKLADALGFLDIQGDAETKLLRASRDERDHVFGIGDWGSPKRNQSTLDGNETAQFENQDTNEPCTSEMMAALAEYDVGKDFYVWVNEQPKGGVVRNWWLDRVVKPCEERHKYEGTAILKICQNPRDIRELAALAVSERGRTTSFGWIVSPWQEGFGRQSYQKRLSQPLSALVSLPSWWGRLTMEVTTCWVRPRKLRGELAPVSLCENQKGQTYRIELPLPGKAQEVLAETWLLHNQNPIP